MFLPSAEEIEGTLADGIYVSVLSIIIHLLEQFINVFENVENLNGKTFKIMAPISYFNRVKIISLIETDVSEARVATQLGLPKR
jgi:hypothetical protein